MSMPVLPIGKGTGHQGSSPTKEHTMIRTAAIVLTAVIGLGLTASSASATRTWDRADAGVVQLSL